MNINYFYSFLLGVFLAVGSLSFPTQIYNIQEMTSVEHGFPITFVVQDISRYDPPVEALPLSYSLLSPWENPTKVLWGKLLLALMTYTLSTFLLLKVFKIIQIKFRHD